MNANRNTAIVRGVSTERAPMSSIRKTSLVAGISSLIIGSGYGGLSIENSLRAIMHGIQNANNKIKKLRPDDSISIQYLEFIELYEDTALSSFYSLSKIEVEDSTSLTIKKDSQKIRILFNSFFK